MLTYCDLAEREMFNKNQFIYFRVFFKIHYINFFLNGNSFVPKSSKRASKFIEKEKVTKDN